MIWLGKKRKSPVKSVYSMIKYGATTFDLVGRDWIFDMVLSLC